MTIYTFKLSKRKLVGAILAIAILIAAIILIIPGKERDTQDGFGAVKAASVKTQADGVSFAETLGYQVEPEPVDCRKVTIPKEFDAVYEKYNAIQKENGFDLSRYCGKGVTLYTFHVVNYTGYDDVLIDLLVYKSKVIGGAVYTASIDGFMHGLTANPTAE